MKDSKTVEPAYQPYGMISETMFKLEASKALILAYIQMRTGAAKWTFCRGDISNVTGYSPKQVSRILKELTSEGILKRCGQSFYKPNRELLMTKYYVKENNETTYSTEDIMSPARAVTEDIMSPAEDTMSPTEDTMSPAEDTMSPIQPINYNLEDKNNNLEPREENMKTLTETENINWTAFWAHAKQIGKFDYYKEYKEKVFKSFLEECRTSTEYDREFLSSQVIRNCDRLIK